MCNSVCYLLYFLHVCTEAALLQVCWLVWQLAKATPFCDGQLRSFGVMRLERQPLTLTLKAS